MTLFAAFGLFTVLATAALIIWPILKHPSLPAKRQRLLSIIVFIIIVLGGFSLYTILGVPQMAAMMADM